MIHINYDMYISTSEIENKLKVGKTWINNNIRPSFIPVTNDEANESSAAIKTNSNVLWYKKTALNDFIIKHIKVYTRDYENKNTKRVRGVEVEISIPKELRDDIMNDKFQYLNLKDFMHMNHYRTHEMAYRWLYENKAYSVKLFGKTYYYIPDFYV